MNKKYKDMGKLIVVCQIFKRTQTPRGLSSSAFDVIWKKENIVQRTGWFVGRHVVYDGTSTWKGESYTFMQGKAVPHILVCFWPTLKPIRVPIESYYLSSTAPKPYCKSELEKKYMRINANIAEHRGKDGRFI